MQQDPSTDPRPIPPEKPLPGDCCGDGCAMCVLDVYEQQLEQYEAALAAWKARIPGARTHPSSGSPPRPGPSGRGAGDRVAGHGDAPA